MAPVQDFSFRPRSSIFVFSRLLTPFHRALSSDDKMPIKQTKRGGVVSGTCMAVADVCFVWCCLPSQTHMDTASSSGTRGLPTGATVGRRTSVPLSVVGRNSRRGAEGESWMAKSLQDESSPPRHTAISSHLSSPPPHSVAV